ncbi:MAG: UDP-2,3-diacylglucosamine diphosphatase [Flavobacterium sp.]
MNNPVIYFASDQHFGAPDSGTSLQREKIFVKWLDHIKKDATHLFLLGDLFDFWFDYDKVVPKGFIRVLGKIAELKDQGISIYFFVGNHDLWMNDYFEKELDIPIFRSPKEFIFYEKNILIGHGDGLGPGDKGYKRMKKVFTHPVSRWLYKWLHPDIGVRIAQYLSVKNKLISGNEDVIYLGEDKEWLVAYCKRKLESKHYDYFIFGHRHLPLEIDLNSNSKYINLGDWISYFTYCKIDEMGASLLKFEN